MPLSEQEELEMLSLERERSMQQPAAVAQAAPAPDLSLADRAVNAGKGLIGGAADFGRGVLAIPRMVGLPPVGGEEFHKRSKEAADWMKKDTGVEGTVASMIPAVAGTAAIRVPKAIVGAASGLLPRALAAGAEGAVGGAITSPEDQLKGAALGGAGGAGLHAVGSVVSEPIRQSEGAKWLRQLGASPTAGQGADKATFMGRAAGALERAATYFPFAGRAVSHQRGDLAEESLRKAAMGRTEYPKVTSPVAGDIEDQVLFRRQQFDASPQHVGTDPEVNLRAIERAVQSATNAGKFSGAQLAAGGRGAKSPAMEQLGRTATDIMPQEGSSHWRDALGFGLGTYGVLNSDHPVGSLAAGVPVYLLMGTKMGQRALAGDHKAQKALAALIRQHSSAPAGTLIAEAGE